MKKGKKAQAYGGISISIFIALIVGLVALSMIWSSVKTSTNPLEVYNESITLVEASQVSLGNSPLVNNSETLYNYSFEIVPSTQYTIDYGDGKINLTSNASFSNSTYGYQAYIDYNYYPTGYIANGLTRTVILFVAPLFVVALLLLVASFKKK